MNYPSWKDSVWQYLRTDLTKGESVPMLQGRLTTVLRKLRRLANMPGDESLDDGVLLARFVDEQDEAAFDELVRRYGPMVLGVCRRILFDAHDADDAFQATFLVLVRKAAALERRPSLGSWLYGVANRVARKARAQAAKRRERQAQALDMSSADNTDDSLDQVDRQEVHNVLDEELQQLPEKYRDPLVLCYLAGKTNEEAARALGCPTGSIWWRLDKARELLRTRLKRRGLELSSAALIAVLAEQLRAGVPPTLAVAARQSAASFLLRAAAGSARQASIFSLAEGVLHAMYFHRLVRTSVALTLLVGLTSLAAFHLIAKPGGEELPALVKSKQSGNWSAAATWEGGKLPPAGSRVLIRPGHKIVYDVNSDKALRSVHVAGTLSFDPNKDTRLDVGLLKVQTDENCLEEGFDCEARPRPFDVTRERSALEIGTPDQPIDAKHSAKVRLVYFKGMNKESLPALVCCGGRLDIHGAPLSRTWVKLGADAKVGDTSVTLAEPVSGWKVGDHVIVTATMRAERDGEFTEERVIKAIDGAKVTLDQPLKQEHLGTGDYRGEIANLSRNVVVESADPQGERGHTMYHRHSDGALSYAEFRHLGKKDVLGRYSLHFHLIGNTMRGSYVIGNSIHDSHNRWLTIHGTNYLVVRDNVGFGSVGHGYFLEDGTEVFNILDRNLAVGAREGKRLPKQVLEFDHNEGAGFWWANSLNTFTRNVATDNDRYGFRYEATASRRTPLEFNVLHPDGRPQVVDIRKLPFVRFEDNEVHSNVGLYGVNLGEGVNRVGPDAKHPFVVKNMKIWDVHYGFRPQVPSLLVDNLTIHKVGYGVYHPNYDNHVYKNVLISQTNTEPFNRGHDDGSIQYGKLTVDGLTFDGIRSYGMPLIQISDDNPEGVAESHFRNIKTPNWQKSRKDAAIINLGGGPRRATKTEKSVPVYVHDYFGPGRHAEVVSMRGPEFKKNPGKYREESPLTGNESRVAEVKDVAFPQLLSPVDDLPPQTVITHVRRDGNRLIVRGSAADNGVIKAVFVNGKQAKPLDENFSQWEVTLDGSSKKLSAHAVDAAGNVEKLSHERYAK